MVSTEYGTTGCAPTDAHHAIVALVAGTLVEVARRRQDQLPGLVETLQDDVVVTTGGTTRRASGWFAEDAWRYGGRQVHELFLNADRRRRHSSVSAAEDALVTLLHEACHVWAKANGIRDTSRGGRYHNRRFAEIALAIGLDVGRDPVVGHCTPTLSARGRSEYADLLGALDRGLVLAREPKSVRSDPDDDKTPSDQPSDPTSTSAPAPSKYVFASCRCEDGRGRTVTIRVANGSWRPGVISCAVCDGTFVES
jgi:hypothetical protein